VLQLEQIRHNSTLLSPAHVRDEAFNVSHHELLSLLNKHRYASAKSKAGAEMEQVMAEVRSAFFGPKLHSTIPLVPNMMLFDVTSAMTEFMVRVLHSRIPLVPTYSRLKPTCV
jgi:hypothetical protein